MMTSRKQHNIHVEELEHAFYDAINRGDINAMMHLWAEDEEIVCIHPNCPRLIGHAEIRASWEAIFELGKIQVQAQQIHVVQNMLTSVHNVIEHFSQAPDLPQDQHILATNIYIKTAHGWRIANHHASMASGALPIDIKKYSAIH
jgi:ketosteroid isomerase-like protein